MHIAIAMQSFFTHYGSMQRRGKVLGARILSEIYTLHTKMRLRLDYGAEIAYNIDELPDGVNR